MDPVAMITLAGITMIVSAILGGFIAYWKNRCADRWGFFCFLFPPILLLLIFLPKSTDVKKRRIRREDFDEELQEWMD